MDREVSVGDLCDDPAGVVAAVRDGERLTLTVNRLPVADIVPHAHERSPWVPSATLRRIVDDAGAGRSLPRYRSAGQSTRRTLILPTPR